MACGDSSILARFPPKLLRRLDFGRATCRHGGQDQVHHFPPMVREDCTKSCMDSQDESLGPWSEHRANKRLSACLRAEIGLWQDFCSEIIGSFSTLLCEGFVAFGKLRACCDARRFGFKPDRGLPMVRPTTRKARVQVRAHLNLSARVLPKSW